MPRSGQLFFYRSPCSPYGIHPRIFQRGDVIDMALFLAGKYFPTRLEARLGRLI